MTEEESALVDIFMDAQYANYGLTFSQNVLAGLKAVLKAKLSSDDAVAILRELNDALLIPGWLQARVDALLDRAEEK